MPGLASETVGVSSFAAKAYLYSMSSLRVSLVQADLVWENKQANLEKLELMINSLRGKTELVLLPEMFSTGFSMRPELLAETMEGEAVAWMKRIAKENRIILAGSLIIREPSDEDKAIYYNRLIWMLPNGHWGSYDKRHLFSYGGENLYYTPGSRRFIASVNGWKINLQICYDLRFPVWARQGSGENLQPEYDLLVYVANWPEKRSYAWQSLLKARAIENQSYVIGVNRVGTDGNGIYHSGDSMIIDPLGEVLASCNGKEEIINFTLHKGPLEEVRLKYPFLNDREFFHIEP